jgi:hypothetical protein
MNQVVGFRDRKVIPPRRKPMKLWALDGLDELAGYSRPVAGSGLEWSKDWGREVLDNLYSTRLTRLTRLEYKKNMGLRLAGLLDAVAGLRDRSPFWATHKARSTCPPRNAKSPQIYSLGSCIEPKQKSGTA